MYPTRFRLPPYLGPATLAVEHLRSYVAGKVARWGQMGMRQTELQDAILYQLALWRRSGYPQPFALKNWRQAPARFAAAAAVRRLLPPARDAAAADRLASRAGRR